MCGSDCTKYWKRTRIKEYVPKVDSTLLRMQVVEPQQWPVDPVKPADSTANRLRRFIGFTYGDTFVDGPLLCILAAILIPALRAQLPERRVARKPPDLKAE